MSYPHIIRLQRHIVAVIPARERIKSNVIHYHAVGVPLHLGIVIVHLRHKVFYIDIGIRFGNHKDGIHVRINAVSAVRYIFAAFVVLHYIFLESTFKV